MSERDKEHIRSRSVRNKEKQSINPFKMDPPAKYSGEKDNDRTYEVVHMFLAQLS